MASTDMDLFDAVYYSRLDQVHRNIYEDADVSIVNSAGNQCIHAAAHAGDPRVIEALVRAGADVNAVGRAGNTPLHYAAKQGRLDAVKFLIAAGADATVKNAHGNTPKDLTNLIERSGSQGDLFADILSEIDGETADKQIVQREKIKSALDESVLLRCSFLKPSRSSTVVEQQSTLPDKQQSTCQDDDPGKAILEAVKPLIAKVSAGDSLIKGGLTVSTPEHRPTLPKHRSRSHSSERSLPGPDTPKEIEEELPPAPWSPPAAGFFVQIDGKQVFVSTAFEDQGDDEGEHSDDDDEEEGAQVGDDDQNLQEEPDCNSDHDSGDEPPSFSLVEISIQPGQVGFGMLLGECGASVSVTALHPAGPALAAGVLEGDILDSVHGTSTLGLLVDDVRALLSQEARLNLDVTIVFRRPL